MPVVRLHVTAFCQSFVDCCTDYYTLLVARLTGADDGEGEIITPRKASGESVVV